MKANCVSKDAYKRLIRARESDCLIGSAKKGLNTLVAWASQGNTASVVKVPNMHIDEGQSQSNQRVTYANENWASVISADTVRQDGMDLSTAKISACMTASPDMDVTLHFSIASV